jgi:hypothetical protein
VTYAGGAPSAGFWYNGRPNRARISVSQFSSTLASLEKSIANRDLRYAVGVARDSLSGFKGTFVFQTDFFCVLHHAADNAAQTPSPGTPSVLPRPDFHSSGNVGRTYLDSDPPQSPQPVRAPNCAPNVMLILIDDVGFGQFSTFGGGVPSPTMNWLAAEELRYNRFNTIARLSAYRQCGATGENADAHAARLLVAASLPTLGLIVNRGVKP